MSIHDNLEVDASGLFSKRMVPENKAQFRRGKEHRCPFSFSLIRNGWVPLVSVPGPSILPKGDA